MKTETEAKKMLSKLDPNSTGLYKGNPAFYIMADANRLFELATNAKKNSDEDLETSLSRAAIIFYPIALEAIINVVYQYCEVYKKNQLKKISVTEKWLKVSQKCLPKLGTFSIDGKVVYRPGDKVESFEEDSIIFQKYLELKEIRNDIVHLKPDFYSIKVKDIEKKSSLGELYPLTKIPKQISNWRLEHAKIAKSIYEEMIKRLHKIMMRHTEWILKAPAFFETITSDAS